MAHNSEHMFLPYGRQTIEEDDIEAVTQVLQSHYLTTGPKTGEFETALAAKLGAKEAVVCGNGTQALHLACIAAGIGPTDAVIVPAITFLATANAARYCGAEVIFADVDPDTGLLTRDTLQQAIDRNRDKHIKVVFPVHLGGQAIDLTDIRDIADTHHLTIIADSCHALGTIYNHHAIGGCAYEDLATFSFHPVKTIAMGEGGAITTNDPEKAALMRKLRSHGMSPRPDSGPWAYEMDALGYNYRASDIHCALGLSQLNKLDRFIARRRELADLYDERLAPLAPVIKPPKRVPNCNPGWHLYAIRMDFERAGVSRTHVMQQLKEQGIGTQVHYIPVHSQPYYERLYGSQHLPGARRYYEHTLSLPLYPGMEQQDAERVVACLKNVSGH